MAKTRRFTPRTQSTPAQIQDNAPNISQSAPDGPPHSEPIGHIDPSINIEVQNSQENHVENQNSQETQPGDENPLPTFKRKSSKCWTVIVDDGVPKEARLRVQDLYSFPSQKKVLVEWNKERQPIGEAGGLLGGFLGSIGADYDIFPIGYLRWPKVPSKIKDKVWDKTIKKIFQVDEHRKKYIVENMGKKWKDTRVRLFAEFYNETLSWEENLESRLDGMDRDQWATFLEYRLEEKTMDISEKNRANREKQTIPHTVGSKTIARKRHELEIQTGRNFSRAEMYSIAHTKKDGTFVNDEAKQKSDLLDVVDEMSSGDDVYTKVFGKEHPGRVRGMGFGVLPSQYLSSGSYNGSSSSGGITSSEYDSLKLELDAANAQVQVLKGEVAKMQTLEEQVAFLMQNFGGQVPARFNQVTDLGSHVEARPSSTASHAPQTHGPSLAEVRPSSTTSQAPKTRGASSVSRAPQTRGSSSRA